MKAFLVAAALALGLVFALGGQPDSSGTQDSSFSARVEQGAESFDGYLEKGLSNRTHDELAQHADKAQGWFVNIGESVAESAQ